MIRAVLHILAAGWLLGGCSVFGSDETPGSMTRDELLSAPETVIVDGHELALRTYMWRDFMPISPPGGKPLTAIFWVFSADSSELPEGLEVDAAWVVKDDEIWDAHLVGDEPPEQLPYQLERIARDGPKWSPFIEVQAIVRLREANGKTHLLRASGQSIERTD